MHTWSISNIYILIYRKDLGSFSLPYLRELVELAQVLDEMATTAAIVAMQDSGSWPTAFNLLRSSKTTSNKDPTTGDTRGNQLEQLG